MLKRIYIEISNICNIQCSFCPIVERDKKILSPTDFKKILSQSHHLAEEICLHLMGEPLAHPDFIEVLNTCQELNTKVQLTTNGLLIKKFSETILNSQSIRQINFSLQSFKDNFPGKNISDYLEKILNFVLLANQKRPDLYINFRLWNLGDNEQENEDIFHFIENFLNIQIKRKIDVGHIKSKRIWNKLYLHFDSRFEWPSLELPYQSQQGKCHALSSHIGIHADGTVVPCCLDKEAQIPLGNALEESLENILNSDRAQKMKTGFENGVLVEELCQHCSYITRFSK